MEEIKTVIDRLKEKLEKLDNENSADLNSINEKQNSISSLNAEIDNLQKQIAARKENMAKLEAKRVEAESFDKSIEEVAPLIDKEEVNEEAPKEEEHVKEEIPVVEETEPEETPVVEEAKEETVEPVEETKEEVAPEQSVLNPTEETDNNMVFPFGDITADLETKEAPFEFKSNMSEFNEPEEEAPNQEEAEIPALEATMEPEQPEVSFTPANGPVFDERGFDISSTLNQTESPSNKLPDIGLNEMYNAPMEQESTRVLR